jgi:hypothetical protein
MRKRVRKEEGRRQSSFCSAAFFCACDPSFWFQRYFFDVLVCDSHRIGLSSFIRSDSEVGKKREGGREGGRKNGEEGR